MEELIIGIVEDGKFRPVFPNRGVPSDLTGIRMQESVPPETRQLDLSEYEDRAIAIQGYDGGGWIYSASVIDVAGPITTTLVRRVIDQKAP